MESVLTFAIPAGHRVFLTGAYPSTTIHATETETGSPPETDVGVTEYNTEMIKKDSAGSVSKSDGESDNLESPLESRGGAAKPTELYVEIPLVNSELHDHVPQDISISNSESCVFQPEKSMEHTNLLSGIVQAANEPVVAVEDSVQNREPSPSAPEIQMNGSDGQSKLRKSRDAGADAESAAPAKRAKIEVFIDGPPKTTEFPSSLVRPSTHYPNAEHIETRIDIASEVSTRVHAGSLNSTRSRIFCNPIQKSQNTKVVFEPEPDQDDSKKLKSMGSADGEASRSEFLNHLNPDLVVPNVAGPTALEKKILRIDGRVRNPPNGNAWKDIRCYRDNQDMGTLWEVRHAWFMRGR